MNERTTTPTGPTQTTPAPTPFQAAPYSLAWKRATSSFPDEPKTYTTFMCRGPQPHPIRLADTLKSSMLEQSLEAFQSQVETSLDRVNTLAKRLKKLKTAAQAGDLREIAKSVGDAKDLATAAQDQCAALSFEFDDTGYFPDAFLAEVVTAAEAKGLKVFAQDGKLYAYPLLVRVKAAERAVQIGKKTERGIRPSALAARLYQLHSKPARFKPADFLGLLYRAYKHCAAKNESPVLTLAEIYDVLTLMPGAAKEYTRDDFARDLYLLDRSGVTTIGVNTMSDGIEFRFSASTGTRSASATLVCIAEDGSEKRYYGINFITPGLIKAER